MSVRGADCWAAQQSKPHFFESLTADDDHISREKTPMT